jgi:hypothetical protein
MSDDPNLPNSYHARAVHDAAEEQGGRFARNTEVRITGTAPTWQAPAIGGTGPWSGADPVPPEEPLGYCIDELPDMTTVSGIDPQLLAPVPDANLEEPDAQ